MANLSLKPNTKGITILIVVAVMIFFGCIMAYLGAAGKLNGAIAERDEKEQQVKDAKAVAQKLEKTRLAYFDACAQLRFLESTVATQAYVPTLLKQLEQVGASSDLKVIGVRPKQGKAQQTSRRLSSGAKAAEGNIEQASQQDAKSGNKKPAVVKKPYNELQVELEMQATYMNALDFIYKLTKFPKVIAVNKVDMSPIKTLGVGSPMLNIKLSITAFILQDDNTTGGKPTENAVSGNSPSEGRNGNEAG